MVELVDPTLPHQLRLLYHPKGKLRATCNCAKWELLYHPEIEGELEKVLAEYKEHLPKD
jgi:hypothetical protein